MNTDSYLMPYFISDNNIISTCDFGQDSINQEEVIYEVIRIIDGVPLFFDEHLTRFFKSTIKLKLKTNLNKQDIAKRVFALIDANKLKIGNIRFQITKTKDYKFTAWVSPFFYPSLEKYKHGVILITHNLEREDPNIKIYKSEYKKKVSSIIKNNNVYEVLLVNSENKITEGSKSNIFFVKDNCIYTPKSSDVLPGITRQKTEEIASKHNIPFEEVEISLSTIADFDGAFITGTSPKILPIKQIDKVKFNPSEQTIVKLMDLYDRLIVNYINAFKRESYI